MANREIPVVPALLQGCPAAGFTTTRLGGVSTGIYTSLNLGDHVGDSPAAVARNRDILRENLPPSTQITWLNQVHGSDVVKAQAGSTPSADAQWTDQVGQVCAVLTADCLPILLACREGRCVAIIHAGWRSLAGGIVKNTVDTLPTSSTQLVAWLGPCISARYFEVGPEVRRAFLSLLGDVAGTSFTPGVGDRYWADLTALARLALHACGVVCIDGGDHCTFNNANRFYSYRRDGQTGRMASVVWLQDKM